MDNGEVIVGLNETWTFFGATVVEWGSGFVMFLMATEFVDKVARSMPLLMIVWVCTTVFLAASRKAFPDEERGLRNWLQVKFGQTPVGLPAPAELQPLWSGAPLMDLPATAQFNVLKLDDMLRLNLEIPTAEQDEATKELNRKASPRVSNNQPTSSEEPNHG